MKMVIEFKRNLVALACVTLALPAHSEITAFGPVIERTKFGSFEEVKSNSSREAVVTKAVLLSQNEAGEAVPECVVDAIRYPELVPRFANKAPADFQSTITLQLRSCNSTEVGVVEYHSAHAVKREDAQFAALPGVVIAGLIICGIFGVGGAVGGAISTSPEKDTVKTLGVAGGSVGALSGFITGFFGAELDPYLRSRTATNKELVRGSAIGLAAGVALGYVCTSLGALAGHKGVAYIQE